MTLVDIYSKFKAVKQRGSSWGKFTQTLMDSKGTRQGVGATARGTRRGAHDKGGGLQGGHGKGEEKYLQ